MPCLLPSPSCHTGSTSSPEDISVALDPSEERLSVVWFGQVRFIREPDPANIGFTIDFRSLLSGGQMLTGKALAGVGSFSCPTSSSTSGPVCSTFALVANCAMRLSRCAQIAAYAAKKQDRSGSKDGKEDSEGKHELAIRDDKRSRWEHKYSGQVAHEDPPRDKHSILMHARVEDKTEKTFNHGLQFARVSSSTSLLRLSTIPS